MSLKPKRTLPIDLATLPADEVEAAQAEGVKVKAILQEARRSRPKAAVTPESVQANADALEGMRLGSERALMSRIKRKELVTKEELIERLGGKRRWVNNALKAEHLFSLSGPCGVDYFPAFFADDSYARRALCKVAYALEGLPGASKYWFFVRKSTRLQMTPLEALAMGRTMEVVRCAIAFAQQ